MITLMNHREIQYHAQKLWEAENIDADQSAQSMFEQWSIQPQREAAQNLMQWLADTGKDVFQEDLILDYGLDCLRLYLLFEKTPKADDPYLDTWEECSLEGLYKFLGKFRRLILATMQWNEQGGYADKEVGDLQRELGQIKCEMLMHFAKGNTMPDRHNALSVLMTGVGRIQKSLDTGSVLRSMHTHDLETAVPHHGQDAAAKAQPNGQILKLCRELVILLAPFAPHLSEELWQTMKQKEKSVLQMQWQDVQWRRQSVTIPVQVNGRTRKTIQVGANASQEECLQFAKESVIKYLDQDADYRCIYVANKIVNYVKNSENK